MQRSMDEEFDPPQVDPQACGRPDCICALPIGERFILWALRQWQCELVDWRHERALPPGGSALVRGFGLAGLPDTLGEFATLMDVLLFGARRALAIHAPSCSCMSGDEAALIALCSLAQGDRDGLLLASLDAMMVPAAADAAALRFKLFALALKGAGMNLPPPQSGAVGRLN
ncbi:MAG: hypothetical protein Q8N31_16215 [Reyranella sp.]|nr:hypothetical protein [Reyranella sp.]MDP3161562.1 hypothetical protein [Reyranella sp.]